MSSIMIILQPILLQYCMLGFFLVSLSWALFLIISYYNLLHFELLLLFSSLDNLWLPTRQEEEETIVLTTLRELFGDLKEIEFTISGMYAIYVIQYVFIIEVFRFIQCTDGPSLGCIIYKTLYKSLTRFVNCLKMVQNIEIKMTYLIVVVFICILGVSMVF